MLGQIIATQGINQRQGHLALAQVVARGLADDGIVKVIKGIVLDLETDAQQAGIAAQLVDGRLRRVVGITAHSRTALKQRRRLGTNDFHVSVLVDVVVARDVHLVNLAQREVAAHVGQRTQDASVACSHAAAQRSRDKEVTDKHCHMVAPHAVDGGLAAPFCRLVDDVVMDERGVVQHLQGSCTLQSLVVDAAKELGTQQRHDGPQELAFVLEVSRHDIVCQLAVTVQRADNNLVEGIEMRPQLFLQICQGNCHESAKVTIIPGYATIFKSNFYKWQQPRVVGTCWSLKTGNLKTGN